MRVNAAALAQQAAGVAASRNLPAPIGGWNTRDSISQMNSRDAVVLDNWFPSTGECQLREGSSLWSTVSNVKSLYQYANQSTQKLLAVSNSGIYDATTESSTPSVAQALTNGYWNAIHITNSAGTTFLWGVNGTDTAKHFDGTTWATPSITGVTSSDLIYPWLFKRRILAIKKQSMSFYYLAIDSIAGAAVEFPCGSLFKLGGFLMAGGTWTIDSGEGADDYCALITSEGEAAIYQGTDPSSASSFRLVGVYYIGRPVGRRCLRQFGGDLLVLTEAGVYPLSRALASSVINYKHAISDKIAPSILEEIRLFENVAGWEMCILPHRSALIVNAPHVQGEQARQFVMNTSTGAWCSFSGWDASCFTLFQGKLYFGTNDGVFLAWEEGLYGDWSFSENVAVPVVGTAQTAYQYLSRGGMKKPGLWRPILTSISSFEVRWGWSTDFKQTSFSSINGDIGALGIPYWDLSPWDITPWIVTNRMDRGWRSMSSPSGYSHSLLLQIAAQYASVTWAGFDVLFTSGGLM